MCALWLWMLLGCLYNSTQASTLLTALDLYPTLPLSQSLSAFWVKQVYRILITFASHATGEAESEQERERERGGVMPHIYFLVPTNTEM